MRKATCPRVSVFLCESTSSPWLLLSVLYHLVIFASSYEATNFEALGVLGRDGKQRWLLTENFRSEFLMFESGAHPVLGHQRVLMSLKNRDVFLRACCTIFAWDPSMIVTTLIIFFKK